MSQTRVFSLQIGSSQWAIHVCRRIPRCGMSEPLLGLCDNGSKRIYVRASLKPMELFYTLAHELIHAFEYELKLDIPHAMVYKMEKPLVDFFVTNFGATLAKALKIKFKKARKRD